MKIILLFVVLISLILLSCNNTKKTSETLEKKNKVNQRIIYTKGYQLMKQKCFICHFEKPDPTRRDQMIAPPMLRVQEHYKPFYPSKVDFIKNVVRFVKNPSEEKTLMPGALRKFKLMPKPNYADSELKLIAEALYNIDFGSISKKHKITNKLKLNNGKKWKLKSTTIEQLNRTINQINSFQSANVLDYNQLGKDIFNDVKSSITDDFYKGKLFNQIHSFFDSIEYNIHNLMDSNSIEHSKQQLSELRIKFKNFNNYFE